MEHGSRQNRGRLFIIPDICRPSIIWRFSVILPMSVRQTVIHVGLEVKESSGAFWCSDVSYTVCEERNEVWSTGCENHRGRPYILLITDRQYIAVILTSLRGMCEWTWPPHFVNCCLRPPITLSRTKRHLVSTSAWDQVVQSVASPFTQLSRLISCSTCKNKNPSLLQDLIFHSNKYKRWWTGPVLDCIVAYNCDVIIVLQRDLATQRISQYAERLTDRRFSCSFSLCPVRWVTCCKFFIRQDKRSY
jgi:hypothetical protein